MITKKKILFKLVLFLTVAFTFSSCGLFYGHRWGCGGPGYYEDQASAARYDVYHYRSRY